jgi:hypothetical protein
MDGVDILSRNFSYKLGNVTRASDRIALNHCRWPCGGLKVMFSQ